MPVLGLVAERQGVSLEEALGDESLGASSFLCKAQLEELDQLKILNFS